MFDLSKPWPLGLARKSWPAVAAGVLAILMLLALIDAPVSQAAIGWPEQWRAPFFFITDYGLSDWILLPSLTLMILMRLAMFPARGLWRQAFGELTLLTAFIFVGVGFPGLMTNILKRLIGRGRPIEYETSGAFSFHGVFNDWTFQSFPSGHSATALATAFVIGFLWPRLFWVFLAIGVAVAVSRVPVGAHYPTDVFAGIVVGIVGTYLVRGFFAKKGWLFEVGPDGTIVRKPFSSLRRLFQRAAE